MMDVFNGANAVLECPIMQGNLYNHLDPYEFRWQLLSGGFISRVDDGLSNNNRDLTIFVDETTRSNQYQCVLVLSRCGITVSRRAGCPVLTYEGPFIQLEVFGKFFPCVFYI